MIGNQALFIEKGFAGSKVINSMLSPQKTTSLIAHSKFDNVFL